MDNKLRPQDKWNKKNGLVSKSYKLNQSVIQSFAEACLLDDVSQSKKMSQLLLSYSDYIERRYNIMFIREKYASGSNYDMILQKAVENQLNCQCESEINSKHKDFRDEVENMNKYSVINNVIENYKEFFLNECSLENILSEQNNDIVNYIVSNITKQQIIFEFMNKGILMPCQMRTNYSTEININYNRGNRLFVISYNLLPFECFMKL